MATRPWSTGPGRAILATAAAATWLERPGPFTVSRAPLMIAIAVPALAARPTMALASGSATFARTACLARSAAPGRPGINPLAALAAFATLRTRPARRPLSRVIPLPARLAARAGAAAGTFPAMRPALIRTLGAGLSCTLATLSGLSPRAAGPIAAPPPWLPGER